MWSNQENRVRKQVKIPVKPVKSRLHKFFTKNWHSPLDSANNACYITYRTKEGKQKENKEISSMRFLKPKFQRNKVKSIIKKLRK